MISNYVPQIRDPFIRLIEPFEEVKLYYACEDEDGSDSPCALCYLKPALGKEGGLVKQKIPNTEKSFFPSFYFRPKERGHSGLEAEFALYERISREIEEFLLFKSGYSNLITDTIKFLVKGGEKKEDVIIILKVLLGEARLYTYKKLKSGEHITFSDLKADAEKCRLYYSSLADEIKIKSDKIALLVSHGQTVGNYREYLLRQLLKKHLPSRFGVATGFIEGFAKQIDIIIYDAFNHAPTFIEEDLVVIRKEAVRAIIEVKSKLTAKELKEALQSFYDITRPGLFYAKPPIFKGIFAFESSYTNTNTIAKAIKDFYNLPHFEDNLQRSATRKIMYLQHEVTCVAVLAKHCLFSQYVLSNKLESDNMVPALLSVSDKWNYDVQTTVFIAMLYDYLDVDFSAKKSTLKAFSGLYRSIHLELKLTADDWLPMCWHPGAKDLSAAGVKKRLHWIDQWFAGNISTSEFLQNDQAKD